MSARPQDRLARPVRPRIWVEATLAERKAMRWVSKTIGIQPKAVLRRYSLNEVVRMYKERSTGLVGIGA